MYPDMKLFHNIKQWCVDMFEVWRREFKMIFSDVGVMLFFFALPIGYPIVYTLIYNPEIVTDLPVAVVDADRTPQSRELTRMIDATQAMKVYDYVPDMAAARRLMNEHKVYGILEIPARYGKRLGRNEQAFATFYCEMDLLLRYRTITAALADIQIALASKIQTQTVNDIGLLAQGMNQAPVASDAVMLGDPTQGFASFIMPGILILIFQQSIVLGVCMLRGGHKERQRRGGVDPLALTGVPATAKLIGKMLCYATLYIPMAYFMLVLLPAMFHLPHIGDMWQFFSFLVPFFIASVFFGRCVSQFVTDRESTLLVVVFTSVVFLFLSGLTWPRFAMNGFWQLVSGVIPATWGMEGFININSDGGTLANESHAYAVLWILSGVYFLLSYLFLRLQTPKTCEVKSLKA